MLIPIPDLPLTTPVRGILHLGAHECEERADYMAHLGVDDAHTVWLEALPDKVADMTRRIPGLRMYQVCLGDQDGADVSFMVTNNGQSSSLLDFGTHAREHPHVVEIGRMPMKTLTLDTFFAQHGLRPADFNFLNLDLQGAELLALRGATDILSRLDYVYTEVNARELYRGCALLPDMDAFLGRYGFVRVQTNMTEHGWGDAFYTKSHDPDS